MRNVICMLLLFCVGCTWMSAQSFDEEKAIQEISDVAASVKTLQCDFIQTKTLKMLDDKIVSEGKMYCSQPNMLRWEYVSPYIYTFILNNDVVMLKSSSRSDVIDVNRNKMFKEIACIMMNSVLGKCLMDKKSFKVSLSDKNPYYVVTLIPMKREMKQTFTKILLYYDRECSMIVKVEMHERNGDNTLIELNHITKNSPINTSVYDIR